jgi:hypothetical protein
LTARPYGLGRIAKRPAYFVADKAPRFFGFVLKFPHVQNDKKQAARYV